MPFIIVRTFRLLCIEKYKKNENSWTFTGSIESYWFAVNEFRGYLSVKSASILTETRCSMFDI